MSGFDAGGQPVRFFPVDIGVYDDLPSLEKQAKAEVDGLQALLAPFGSVPVPWAVPQSEREPLAVFKRLDEWVALPPGPTVLYWAGHGFAESLACARRRDTVDPNRIATAIRKRHVALKQADAWSIVVIDACSSGPFVNQVIKVLDGTNVRDVLLIGTAGDGGVPLGGFRRILASALEPRRGEDVVTLRDLSHRLEDGLAAGKSGAARPEVHSIHLGPGAALSPVAATATQVTLDIKQHLDAALQTLTPQERSHFFTKAQSAGFGETGWFFRGRAAQLGKIVAWLLDGDGNAAERGMLVVTGRAGSGKSALLGQALVHTWPEVRQALEKAGLLTERLIDDVQLDNVFEASVHVTGASTSRVVEQLGSILRWNRPLDSFAVRERHDALVEAARANLGKTILIDALDEAQRPLEIARLLCRLANAHGVRFVVGTRASTRERLDEAVADDDILNALGPERTRVDVEREAGLIGEFARMRLQDVDPTGTAAQAIEDAARAKHREFLWATLAVNELRARPELIGDATQRAELLATNHAGLFSAAAERIGAATGRNAHLLAALGHARGRGMPLAESILATAAAALTDFEIGDADVNRFLDGQLRDRRS
jgi:hypothetical protein